MSPKVLKPIIDTAVDRVEFMFPAKSDPIKVDEHISQSGSQQASMTGHTSFMNCVVVGLPVLTFNIKADKNFLHRFNLKLNSVYIFNSPDREILVEALKKYGSQLMDCPVTPGGIAFNVARLAQWLQPQAKSVVFLGARSMDEDSQNVVEICRTSRIGIRMEEIPKSKPCVLLVLHLKKWCCEIYFTDQIPQMTAAFIDKPIVTKVLERANFIFTSDISILLMPRVNKSIAYFAFSRFKQLLLIMHSFKPLEKAKDSISEILTYVDILFLTPKSAEKLVEVYDVPCCCPPRYAKDIYVWLKQFCKRSCTVVVSDGLLKADIHTDMCTNKSAKFQSKFNKDHKVVDYYGVTYAFVGGFMAMMMRGCQIDPCVECGFFCAGLVASTYGMTLPEKNRDDVLGRWYSALDTIIGKKNSSSDLKRFNSGLPFTVFQTPWKEPDVNNVFP